MAKFPRIFFLVVGWIGITIIALSVISVATGTEITNFLKQFFLSYSWKTRM